MAWIDDVVTHTTIRSVWGNGVRDRTVHQFASIAERDAAPASSRQDGSLCATAADKRLWRYRVDLARWIIVDEPWQPYSPQCFVGASGALPSQIDIAETKMTGDLVTLRIVAKVTPGGALGTMFINLPASRTNKESPQSGAGVLAATDYRTGLTTGAAPVMEFGRFYGRTMADWSAVGPTGLDFSLSGTFIYRSSGYGP